MSKLIDVIIPMYNRADCVENIIKELEKQTFKDFRAIFVDDGSKDNTLEVLKDSLKNAKFESLIVEKQNGGAASARNAGVRASNSEWIVFVDSDDGIREEYLEYLYRAVSESNSDLGICSMQTLIQGVSNQKIDSKKVFEYRNITPAEAMKYYCQNWIGPVCLIIKRDMQQKKQLFFDELCIYNEDAPYIADVIVGSSKVALINQRLYLYYTHLGSLHRSPSIEKYFSAIKSFSNMEQKLSKVDSPAAKVFNEMGGARFYIATLRRSAVQMKYRDFLTLEKEINFKRYKNQIKNLLLSQRVAAYMFLISKPIFWFLMRSMFKD